jgi:hypothetical protein
VLRISELGLVEMTRKRVRESIGRMLHEDCGYCGGQGFVKTATTVAYEIFREIRRETPNFKDPTLVVNCNVEVARLLQAEERQELRHLMDRYNKTIQVRPQTNYHREQYDLYGAARTARTHKVASSSVEPPCAGGPWVSRWSAGEPVARGASCGSPVTGGKTAGTENARRVPFPRLAHPPRKPSHPSPRP